jgi:hypothetical protein
MKLPVLLRSSSCTHAVTTAPADSLGARSRSLPQKVAAFPMSEVGRLRISSFEACSMFTHITAYVLAESPKVTLLHQRASPNRVSFSIAPTATGWSESCQVGFAPTRRPRLSTAHPDRLLVLGVCRYNRGAASPASMIQTVTIGLSVTDVARIVVIRLACRRPKPQWSATWIATPHTARLRRRRAAPHRSWRKLVRSTHR